MTTSVIPPPRTPARTSVARAPGERVRLDEQVSWHDRGHDRREGWLEDGLPDPIDDDEPHDERDGQPSGDGQGADRRDRGTADHVAGDHQLAPVEPIRQGTGEEHQQHLGQRPGHADERQRRWVVGKLIDLPGDGDDVDAVSDHRDGHPRPQERAKSRRRSGRRMPMRPGSSSLTDRGYGSLPLDG